VGTVRIIYRVGTISLQAAVHPEHKLGALNMNEEEAGERTCKNCALLFVCVCVCIYLCRGRSIHTYIYTWKTVIIIIIIESTH
jgi:hypothetical protein